MGDGRENNVRGRKLTEIYCSFLCFCLQIRWKENGGRIMAVVWKKLRQMFTMQTMIRRESHSGQFILGINKHHFLYFGTFNLDFKRHSVTNILYEMTLGHD
jgi:hypothetical protein